MDKQAEMINWTWKSDSIKEYKLLKEWPKSKHSFFLMKIHRPVIWNLSFETVL